MPPRSEAQRRLFRWAAAHPSAARKRGIKPGVASEFNKTDPGGHLPAKVKARHARKK
jgi:hypothetical protein